jgi:CRP/FNR family transcriptional regulator
VRQSKDGREQVLSTEEPGSVLAIAPIVNGGRYMSTMIADLNSTVLCIPGPDVHRFCRQYPELLWRISNQLAHQLRSFADLIETLSLRTVHQRLAQYVLSLCDHQGVITGDRSVVDLRLNQSEIANRIGSVREGVSRAFSHLQQIGLIEMAKSHRTVTVTSLTELRSFVGFASSLEDINQLTPGLFR